MSIFGTSYSRMKSGATEIDLRHSIIRPTWTEPNIIEQKSIVTGIYSYIHISADKARFQVVCNIWKNGSPAVIMADLLSYNHDTVKFNPHVTGGFDYIVDNSGMEVDFFILSMIPYYVNNEPPMLQDKLQITFLSLTDLRLPGSSPHYLIDAEGDYFIDGSGNKMRIKTTGQERA